MNKFDDERIQIQKLKIINGAYLIIMAILMISMLVNCLSYRQNSRTT